MDGPDASALRRQACRPADLTRISGRASYWAHIQRDHRLIAQQRLPGVRGLGAGQLGERLQARARAMPRATAASPEATTARRRAGRLLVRRAAPPRRIKQRGHRVGRSLPRMTLDPHVIRALVEGEHGDPFALAAVIRDKAAPDLPASNPLSGVS